MSNEKKHRRRPTLPHPGERDWFDSASKILSSEDQADYRRKKGLCPTCGLIRTHKLTVWNSLSPEVCAFGLHMISIYFYFSHIPVSSRCALLQC